MALLNSPKYDVQLNSIQVLKNVSVSDSILQKIVEAQGIPRFIGNNRTLGVTHISRFDVLSK